MLADMAMAVHASRLVVHHAAALIDRGATDTALEASMAKCLASDTAMKVATDAVQIFGGYGYTREFPVERFMRDAKITQIYEGTNQIQRVVIAQQLLGTVLPVDPGSTRAEPSRRTAPCATESPLRRSPPDLPQGRRLARRALPPARRRSASRRCCAPRRTTFKIGVVHPITGPLAEPGQACRLGAQMAADAINAAGGIKSLGGAKLELVLGDTQTKPDVGRTEAERVINQGAQMLMGSFDSGSTAAMVPVAQQRRVPFLVDIAAADPITANVAKAVKEGQQKVQYVYRNFPTGSSFGRKAVQYFTEVFKEARRVAEAGGADVLQRPVRPELAKGFQAAHAAAKPGVGDRRT